MSSPTPLAAARCVEIGGEPVGDVDGGVRAAVGEPARLAEPRDGMGEAPAMLVVEPVAAVPGGDGRAGSAETARDVDRVAGPHPLRRSGAKAEPSTVVVRPRRARRRADIAAEDRRAGRADGVADAVGELGELLSCHRPAAPKATRMPNGCAAIAARSLSAAVTAR